MDDEDDDEDEADQILLDDNLDGVPMVDSSDEEGDQDEQTTGQEPAGHEHEPEPVPHPRPSVKDEDYSEATTDTPAAPLNTRHDPEAQSSQARRVRPRAADFDDMFE